METLFVDMPFAQCEQEVSYCRRLRDAIGANMEATERNPELQSWSFDEPHTNTYLLCVSTHRTRALELEIRQRTAVHNPIIVGLHNLDIFAVLSKDCNRHYVSMSAVWQNLEGNRMLHVPSHPMSVYYSSAFGCDAQWLGYLLLETAIMKFTIMFFVCFT